MTQTAGQKRGLAEIQEVIEHNARSLNEKPDIGVRLLRDGRVRIYDLARGWRAWPYREYSSLDVAVDAARQAARTAKRVERLISDGVSKAEAILREAYR